ncbi:MAG TPA: WS/DGAT domain-containing protein [Mycobacterium sp.]|nr:WS/DGAT domain-containing protein [Mycobacterium sp.]
MSTTRCGCTTRNSTSVATCTASTRWGRYFHGSGLNITAMSLEGKLDIGLVACPDLLPALWEMADEFAVGMEELFALAR